MDTAALWNMGSNCEPPVGKVAPYKDAPLLRPQSTSPQLSARSQLSADGGKYDPDVVLSC